MLLRSFLLLPLVLLATACDEILDGLGPDETTEETGGGPPTQFQTDAPQFHLPTFVDNLEASLNGSPGVAVVVIEGGNRADVREIGNATYAPDPEGDLPMTVDTELPVASVSKFVGAIALLNALDEAGIDVDDPIVDHLPPGWRDLVHDDHTEAGAFTITFAGLLRMETGLAWPSAAMPTTNEMLATLRLPAIASLWGDYQNGNFALIRVLIGELAFGLDERDAGYNLDTAESYEAYIADRIFDPLGISGVGHTKASGSVSRGYQNPLDLTFQDGNGFVGWDASDSWPNNPGSGGLYLSAMQLAEVLAYARHDTEETILSADRQAELWDRGLGLTEPRIGDHGLYHSKAGMRGADSNGRGYRSRIMIYPNDVEVVVLANSEVPGLGSGSLLVSAFDDAWLAP